MYFAKDEIIELNDEKKYLISDNALIDEITYYKVKEVNNEQKELIGEFKYISAENIEGKLFITEITDAQILAKLEELLN